MSGTGEHPRLPGGGRILMLGTAVLAVLAAAVLALGIQDARLLRLGLLAALWAALLGAFATARARRETSSCAEHADRLRMVYQRELEREVAARREHALRVERGFHEQAGRSQQREIVQLRTELAALRLELEQLLVSYRRAAPAAMIGPELHFVPERYRNGEPAYRAAGEASWTSPPAQRTVSDLLAAHEAASTGVASTPRRRRSHDQHPATSA